MKTTVSKKHQIVIPKAIRRKLGILPGEKMQVSAAKNGTLIVRREQPTSYHDLLGTIPPQPEDAVVRIRKLRDEWRG